MLYLINKFVDRIELKNNKIIYFNLLNTSLIIDDKYNSLNFKEFVNKSSISEKKLLREMEFILSTPEDKFVKKQINKFKYIERNYDIPGDITFIPTYKCNFSCPYCSPHHYEQKYLSVNKDHLTFNQEVLNKVFNYISKDKRILKALRKRTHFYGGEPLLKENKSIIINIFNYLKQKKCKLITIPTNGYDIENYIDVFKDYLKSVPDSRIVIQITIDGDKQSHNKTRILANGDGSFDKIIVNINLLKKIRHLELVLRTNLSLENKTNLSKYIDFLKKSGWVNKPNIVFSFIPLFNEQLSCNYENHISDNELSLFLLTLIKNKIYNVRTHSVLDNIFQIFNPKNKTNKLDTLKRCKCFTITPDGNFFACIYCDTKVSIGNINSGFDYKKFSKLMFGQKWNINKCKHCKYFFICSGGDRMTSLNMYNSPSKAVCNSFRMNYISLIKSADKLGLIK
jgi:uncharacterized protein